VNITDTKNDHPTISTQDVIVPDFLLLPVIESAFNVIKGQETNQIPSTLRRISNFDAKTLHHSTARAQIISSLNANNNFRELVDEEFFSRVEANVALSTWSINNAGPTIEEFASRNDLPLIASMLWLRRPQGYEFGLGLILAYSSISISQTDLRESQLAQDSKISNMSKSLEIEKERTKMLGGEVSRIEEELRNERKNRKVKEQRYESNIAALEKQILQSDTIMDRIKEDEKRASERLEREASRARELEVRLRLAEKESGDKGKKIADLQEQLASALSSEIELNYEDLQNLIKSQAHAQDISMSLLSIMNKTRSILSKTNNRAESQVLLEQDVKTADQIKKQKTEIVKDRSAVVIPIGMNIESKNALVEIFRQEKVMLIIDGYNVSLNSFANLSLELQREQTINCAANIESRFSTNCTVIFDGESNTTRASMRSKVHVVFSPGDRTADDLIVERIQVTPSDRPIILVTNDENLKRRAKGLGCQTISTSAFVQFSR
jgi:hypothetical protein